MTTALSRRFRRAVLPLSLTLSLTACGDSSSDSQGADAPDPSAADVADEIREAGDVAGEFVADSWDRFKATMDDRLDDAGSRIDELQVRVAELDDEAKAAMNARIEDLRQQRRQIAQELEAAQSDADRAWRDVAAGLQDAWQDLDRAVSNAAARFDEDSDGGSGGSGGAGGAGG